MRLSIIDTDCEADFAIPLDYREPKKEQIVAEQKKVDERDI